ncbi:MAG: TonB-dependent receptor [Caulobacteraceae bacterium]|nr:TonB-dependent receptor [Caulobacteraceae bacterium]
MAAGAAVLALPSAVSAATATAADTAAATDQSTTSLQEVVVQARRSSENLQKVPVAVTVVTQKAIDTVGVFDPQNLANFTPGLTVPATISDRANVVYAIRGQSNSYGNQFNAVIPYYDDVPIVSPTGLGHGAFFDLDSVQVLRGPQGTQFGRVTDGGNVMIYPKKPSNSFDGYVEGKVGDYGLRDFTAAINLPIIPDKLMVRAATDISRRDGFTTNLFNGRDLDNVAYESYRFGIVIKPTEHLENYTSIAYEHTHENGTSVELEYLYQPIVGAIANAVAGAGNPIAPLYGIDALGNVVPAAQGVQAFTPANYLAALNAGVTRQLALGPRQVFDTNPLFDNRDNIFVVNTTTADLGVVTVKNIFGFIWTKDVEAQNFSGGNGQLIVPCHSGCPGAFLPFNFQEQFSDEFRLSGKLFDDRVSWSAGAYTDAQKPAGAFENATLSTGFTQRVGVQYTKTWETAGYGNAEIDLRDFVQGLKISGGVRYTVDDNHTQETTYLAPSPAPGLPASVTTIPHGVCVPFGTPPSPCLEATTHYNALTYTGGASYQITPSQMLYAKVSQGYRPGGLNGTAPPGVDPRYQPEYDLSVEIGAKADFDFNGVKLRTNVALFHDNYSKIQQNVVLPTAAGQAPVSAVRNVDDAVIQGVEFEGTLLPFRGMTLNLVYAYTDAAFRHLATDYPLSNGVSPCNPFAFAIAGFCGHNAFGFTPRNKLGLSADYELPLDPAIGVITFGGTWNYQSKVWLITTSNLDPHAVQPAYSTLDLRATWHQIYGHPVDLSFFMTNVTNQLYKAGVDDLEQASSLGDYAAIYAPPRMFGFGLKYRFGSSAGS